MSFTIQGGSLMPAQVKLTTTAPTVLVDAGSSGAIVVGIYCAEIAGGTPALTLEKFDGVTSYYLRAAKPMTAREEYVNDAVMLVLKPGMQLRVTSSVANSIDAQATYIPGDRTAKG